MTIIIAAICQRESAIIVAADRMTVFGSGDQSVRSEDFKSKIFRVGANSVLLHTGDSQDAPSIVREIETEFEGDDQISLNQLFECLKRKSWERSLEKREAYIKSRIGFECERDEIKELIKLGAANRGNDLNGIWQSAVTEHSAGGFLLAGYESHGKPAIYAVASSHLHGSRKIERPYAVDGSGFHYAYASLVNGWPKEHSLTLEDVIYNVFCAKKAAEVSDGVGKSTDISVLAPEYRVVSGVCPVLQRVFEARQFLRDDEIRELTEKLDELNMEVRPHAIPR